MHLNCAAGAFVGLEEDDPIPRGAASLGAGGGGRNAHCAKELSIQDKGGGSGGYEHHKGPEEGDRAGPPGAAG